MRKLTLATMRTAGLTMLLAVSLVSTVTAGAPHHKGHGWAGPIFGIMHHLDHLELSDHQMEEIESILKRLHSERQPRKGKRALLQSFLTTSPNDADYDAVTAEQAKQAGRMAEEKMRLVADVRRQIYAVLNDDQERALEKAMSRKMERMRARHARRQTAQ